VNPPSPLVHFSASPSVGRLGDDQGVSAVQAATGVVDIATAVATMPGLGARVRHAQTAWNPETGQQRPGFVQPIQGLAAFSAPAIADVSGDGKPDTILGADSAALHAFDGVTGRPVPNWPKWTGGWTLFTPAVGDLDGDGRVEVAIGLREGLLRVWRTPGRAEANDQAWHWHQNDRNTGLHGEDTRPPSAVRDLRVKREAGRSVVSFRASGDDWNAGRADRFAVYRSRRPISAASLQSAQRVATVGAAPAGTVQRVVVPRPRSRVVRPYVFAVRGVDDAGTSARFPAPPDSAVSRAARSPSASGGASSRRPSGSASAASACAAATGG
jgi:hypothetical protein